jgi:hypothetical protein
MDSTVLTTPGSVQRSIAATKDRPIEAPPVPASQLADQAIRAEIAELAYLIWEEHGYPVGSAESDWLEAERRMQRAVKVGPIKS